MTINIDTLGKASRHRMVLHITCRHCGHKGQIKARELARAYGFGTDPRTLTFRCSRCDMRNCIVRVMEEMRR